MRVEQSTLRRFALTLSPSPECAAWQLGELSAARAAAATEAEASGEDDDRGRAQVSWLCDDVRRGRSGGRANRNGGGLDAEGAAPSSASVKVKC